MDADITKLRDTIAAGIDPDVIKTNLPTPAEFERLLREKYEPILSAEDYALLREKCGLGAVIDGEVI